MLGRFISADTVDVLTAEDQNLLQYNLYIYCFNNPVNLQDSSDTWPDWATKVAIGTAVIAAAAILTVATAGTGTAVACFVVGALKGSIAGAAMGAASGALEGSVNHRIKTGSWKGAGKAALDGAANGYMTGAISGFVSGGMSSKSCFVAGTVVLTVLGKIAIENIRAGDLVWAEDPETGEIAIKEVVRTFVNETSELVHVYAGGEEIVTTPEHPFYVPTKGWTGAVHLRAGDILVLRSGEYVIVEMIQHEILESPVTVYNFEVEDLHTYYVGDDSVLVHNLCSKKAAMRAAKRSENIPMSQKPESIEWVKMTGSNGRTVWAKKEIYKIGNTRKYIRNDVGGHLFKDGATMGRHYNAGIIKTGKDISNGLHFFY